jgi:hypothetical protein
MRFVQQPCPADTFFVDFFGFCDTGRSKEKPDGNAGPNAGTVGVASTEPALIAETSAVGPVREVRPEEAGDGWAFPTDVCLFCVGATGNSAVSMVAISTLENAEKPWMFSPGLGASERAEPLLDP